MVLDVFLCYLLHDPFDQEIYSNPKSLNVNERVDEFNRTIRIMLQFGYLNIP